MLSGLHMSNGPLTEADLLAVRAGGFPSAKLMWYHGGLEVATLRAEGVKDFTYRLPDSRLPDGRYMLADEYAAVCLSHILRFYALGIVRGQVDNEPNVWGMWDHHGYGPWQYQFFMRAVLRLLTPHLPPDVILVCPPLSFSPALWNHDPPGTDWDDRQNKTDFVLNDWWAAFHFTDGGRHPSLWRTFLWHERPNSGGEREGGEVGANVYWQSLRQMADSSYGAAHEQLRARSQGMDVCDVEYANSASRKYNPDGTPVYTRAQVEEMRRVQYPAWLRDARSLGYVTRAYVYISPGASQDWSDFRLTQTEAASIGAEETREGGRTVGGGRGII